MQTTYHSRREFLGISAIGVASLVLPQREDFISSLYEFREYISNVVGDWKARNPKRGDEYPADFRIRDIYNMVNNGKNITLNVLLPHPIAPSIGITLEMIVKYQSGDSNLTTWQGGRGVHEYDDPGIRGNLLGGDASFSFFEESSKEYLFSSNLTGYLFEKVRHSKSNEKCRRSDFEATYCVESRAEWDAETGELRKYGVYSHLKHDDFMARIREASSKANAEYRQILVEIINELKKSGKIKK